MIGAGSGDMDGTPVRHWSALPTPQPCIGAAPREYPEQYRSKYPVSTPSSTPHPKACSGGDALRFALAVGTTAATATACGYTSGPVRRSLPCGFGLAPNRLSICAISSAACRLCVFVWRR